MLRTHMVFSNNDLFNVTHTEMDQNVDRLIQQQVYQQQQQQQQPHQHQMQHPHHPAANVMASASPSPIQDYHLLDPSSSSSSSSSHINASQQSHNPQNHSHPQQHQQHQQQLHQPQQYRQSPPQPRRQRSLPQPPPLQPPTRHQHYPQEQQQQHQPSQVTPSSQQQQNMQYSMMVSPMMVGNLSAPSSPSYSVVKTEEGLHHQNLEYLVYSSFEMQSPSTPQQQHAHHIIPSQRSSHTLSSPQQRILSYGEVPFMHQRQHSQHQQQIRIQQQQQQRAIEQHQQQYQQYHSHHQLMYDPTSTNSTSTNPSRSTISSAMSMSMPLSVSIPVTSGSSTLLINSSPTANNSSTTNNNSANLFAPSSAGIAATPMPFFNPPSSTSSSAAAVLAKGETSAHKMTTAAMMATLQHRGVHPQATAVSPKRQRSNSGHQHQQHHLALPSQNSITGLIHGQIPSSSPHNTIAAAAAAATTTTTTAITGAKRSRRSSGASSSSRSGAASTNLQAVETDIDARASKVAKTSAMSSAPVAAFIAAATVAETKSTARRPSAKGSSSSALTEHSQPQLSQTRTSSSSIAHAQPHLTDYTHLAHTQQTPHSINTTTGPKTAAAGGNVTHPRRAAQNRAAQRTFRNRRKAYIKDMEQKVLELHQMRARFEEVQIENREIWRRYRVLESVVLQSGLPLPAFATTLTPFHETDAGIAAQAQAAAHAAATAAATAAGNLNRQSSEIDGEGEDEALLTLQGHGFHDNKQGSLDHQSDDDQDEDDEDDEDGEHVVDPSYSSSARTDARRPL